MDSKCTDAAEKGVAKLSREQLLDLGVGADFWRTRAYPEAGIPALTVSDGPNGLRYQRPGNDVRGAGPAEPATCFPCLATVAATWDAELAGQMGRAIGHEARSLGVGVVLGPGLNIKRSPLCGRNFEYLSEDPYLAGTLGASYVRGVQSTGVGSCIKHFAVNNQEYKRFSNDCVVDERTLREIYLRAFQMVVREAKPQMVMSAYVMLNGIYCSDNGHLLRDILRDEWRFDGVVVTDWGGMHDRAVAYEAGCDLAMPGGGKHLQAQAAAALDAGTLREERVRESARRLAALAISHANDAQGAPAVDVEANRAVARRVAAEGHVLLTNNGVLPLAAGASVALVGQMSDRPRYQGGGSSHINARHVSSIRGLRPGWAYAAGYDARTGATTDALVAEAVRAARGADVAVVVCGLPETVESEGYDRPDMRLPKGMNRLVKAVAAANPNTVVVLQCGSPVELPWEKDVAAVLYAGLGGEAGAEATVDVLEGTVNPSGRLPETWPLTADDAPCMGWWGRPHRQSQYREGVFVGYRYYQTAGVPVAHCFGHGLSYTSFAYGNLELDPGDGRGHGATASFDVTNVGAVAGAEVAQVYVSAPEGGLPRPARVLAGFARVELAPSQTRRVSVTLDPAAFAVWDGAWKTIGGMYQVLVGASVEDVRLTGELAVSGKGIARPARLLGTWYAAPHGKPGEKDFEALLGRPIPPEAHHAKGTYDETDSLLEMGRTSGVCRFIAGQIKAAVERGYKDKTDPQCRMSIASSAGCALFGLVNCSGGAMPAGMARALLNVANGHAPWRKG